MRDEYNVIQITNDKQINAKEYGKTQKQEFSSQDENKLPEGDLNEKYVGKTIGKKTELNVSYTKNVPSHGSETIVTSSASATSIASTASSVVAVASTVAVTAVAVATGISVVLHDYEYKFNSFIVTSDSLTYELVIIDNKSEEKYDYEYEQYNDAHRNEALDPDAPHDNNEPFVLRVYNNNYDYSMSAWLNYNYGTFSGLTLGETYHIALSENRYGGETIFDETFTTYERSKFNSFYISGAADFITNSFYVEMDFIDENNQFSDFNLTFYENEGTITFPLEKINGQQKVEQGQTNFRPLDTYPYEFSYKNNEDVVEFASGEVTFYDTSGGISNVNGVVWNKEANYLTNEFDVRLEYQDDFDFFSGFSLTLTQGELSETFDLLKSLETQTLKANNIDFSKSCNYSFTYFNRGVKTVIEEGTILFTDNSGGISEVSGVTWDKTADYLHRTIEVKLNYQDDFNRFSDFSLTLSSFEQTNSIEETFPLQKETVKQTITLDENSLIDFDNTYYYSFKYKELGVEKEIESGTVKFTDNSGSISEVTGVTWDKKVNYLTKTIEVKLNYQDDLSRFSDFAFSITQVDNTNNSATFSLAKQTTVQTITLSSQSFDFVYDSEYSYSFTYKDKGVSKTIEEGTEMLLDNSGAVSIVNGVIWDKTVNYLTSEIEITLDYVDELNRFSDFSFYIEENIEEAPQSAVFPLTKTTEKQTITLIKDSFEFDYDKEYKYSFTYKNLGTNVTIDSGTQKFNDNSGSISEVTGVTWDKKVNYITSEMAFKLNYTDDLNRFSNFRFNIEEYIPSPSDVGEAVISEPIVPDSGSFLLDKTTDEQTIILRSESFEFKYDTTYNYSFAYEDRGVSKTIESGTALIEDNSGSVTSFDGLDFEKAANFLTREFDVKLNYTDDLERMSDFTFILKDRETLNTKTFNLTKTEDVQTLVCDELDEEERYRIDVVENPMSYSFYYYLDGIKQDVVTNEDFVFTNTLHSEVTNVETSFDFTCGAYVPEGDPATSATYVLPMKIEFDDQEEKWSGFTVTINNHETDAIVSTLSYNEGEDSLDGRWHYLALTDDYVDDIVNGDEYDVVVWGDLYRENDLGEMREVIYRESHVLTRDRSVSFYDLLMPSNMITSTTIEVLPIFSGYSSQTKMRLVIRSAENTYRYDFYALGFANESVYIDLSTAIDSNWVEETFGSEVESGGFDIYVYYYTYPVNVVGLEPAELEALEPTEEQYTQIACYTNYHFEFAV